MEWMVIDVEEREVELLDYIVVLCRRKWVIVVSFLAAAISAWVGTLALPPVYEAETSLLLLPTLSSQLNAEAVGSRLAPEAYAQLAVSTAVLRTVASDLDMTGEADLQDLKKRISVTVKPLSQKNEIYLSARLRASSRAWLLSAARSWTAAFALTYADLFQDRTARSYDYISANLAQTEQQLNLAISSRALFRQDHPLSMMQAEVDALEAELLSFQREADRRERDLPADRQYLASHRNSRTAKLPDVYLSGADPLSLAGALLYGLSPDDYATAVQARLVVLAQAISSTSADLVGKWTALHEAEAREESLTREIGLLTSAYKDLSTQLQAARIAVAETPEPIRVVNEPLVSESPVAPNRRTTVAVAGFLGLLAGVLLAFMFDYLERVRERTRTARDPR